MASEYVPVVSQELVKHIRASRRDWQNILPEADWTMEQIQRAIGANEVIEYLQDLVNRQMGLISDPD